MARSGGVVCGGVGSTLGNRERRTMNFLAIAGLVSVGSFGLLRLLQSAPLQQALPEQYRWRQWKLGAQLLTVFALSFAGTLLGAYAGGAPLLAALPDALRAALGAAFGAVGLHEVTKDIGSATTPVDKEPGSIRTMLNPVFPVDWEKARNSDTEKKKAVGQ
jgi:hypothetical protein